MAASGFLQRLVVEACVVACLAPLASAATFMVDVTTDSVDAVAGDGTCADAAGACSLRAAILEANALPGADVVMLPAGTFVLTIQGADEDRAATGDLDVRESLTIEGVGRDDTIIDGRGLWPGEPFMGDRLLDVLGGGVLTLRAMTVEDGRTEIGGGIRVLSSVLDATDVLIGFNSAFSAFGVFSDKSTLTLTRVKVASNWANDGWGDGIGGGLLIDGGSVTMAECVVEDHWATVGAGIALRGGALVLRDTTVRNNSAVEAGGGLALGIDAPTRPPTVTIERSTIVGNYLGMAGGGIDLQTGTLVMRNSTITGNDAMHGAGMHVHAAGIAMLSNVTIARNVSTMDAQEGGGGGVLADPGARVSAANILVADDECNGVPGTVGVDWQGELISLGHNLVEDPTLTVVLGDITGVIVGRDPRLRPLRDHGGSTLTHMLGPDSPAIDAGSPLTPGSGDPACEGTDQRFVGRPFGAACDLGAVEYDCLDATDSDGDGTGDACDTCPGMVNPDQADFDGDGEGDACDADDDGDGVMDLEDDCPRADDPSQDDWDSDGVGTACDNCRVVRNPSQADQDVDGAGDACDNCPQTPSPGQQDGDGDTIGDACDTCTDPDNDGFGNPGLPATTCPLDDCILTNNPFQEDSDRDGFGDVCDNCTEPSAVDLSPAALPLRVTKLAGGALRVSWWVPTVAYVDIVRGTVPMNETLGARAESGPSAYDHAAFGECNLLVTEIDVVPVPGGEYFLAGAHCFLGGASFVTGSLGRDSFDREIPPAATPCP